MEQPFSFSFFFFHAVNEVVSGNGRGVFITAGTSKPSAGVAGIPGEKSSKIDQSGCILRGWMRCVVYESIMVTIHYCVISVLCSFLQQE